MSPPAVAGAPAPVAAPGVDGPAEQPAPVPAAPGAPPQTASGVPNPHGLPEIAVERPEVAVGAAFGAGLVFALILKRLAR